MSLGIKRSKSAIEYARKKWKYNLTTATKLCPSIAEVKKDINEIMCGMPLNRDIFDRFLGLHDKVEGRADRVKKISEELLKLRDKLSFLFISKQQVLFSKG